MKPIRFLLPTIIVVLSVVSCNNSSPSVDETQILFQLNSQYDSALLKKDTALLKTIYADDFKLTNPDGRLMTKQEQLLNVATSELIWQSAKSENVTINFYGNTAVLVGEFKGNSSYRGNPISVHERYTTVWVKTGNSWQIVAEQANLIR